MADDITTYKGLYPSVLKKVNPVDYKVNPFQAFKQFTFDSSSAMADGYKQLQGIYVSGFPDISSSVTFNDAINSDGSYQFSIYYSINQLYYKRKAEPSKTHGPTDLTRTSKFLYITASVFSIPQIKFGESIKPTSFTYTGSVHLKSDRYGNIYDTTIDTGSFPGNEMFYEGYNEYFDTSRITMYATASGATYINGVNTSNGLYGNIGFAARLSGSGYFEKTLLDGYYDRDHDYAISFFIGSGSNVSAYPELILGKVTGSVTPQYPFKIELSGSNQLLFSAAGSTEYTANISSSALVTGSWQHVLCQKTGSSLQMYINATLHSSVSSNLLLADTLTPFTASARIDNTYPLKIGGYNTNTRNLHGDLDEIRIFNKSLTQAEITSLADRSEGGGMLQTNRVGNVFTKQGLVVISSPDYRYDNVITASYTSSYNSTISLFEHSVLTRIDAGDFNVSQNVTLLKDNDQDLKAFATGSDFTPYITTIGLYNDYGQLLAIGKLGTPIKKRNDIDMNFLISIDLDRPKPPKLKSIFNVKPLISVSHKDYVLDRIEEHNSLKQEILKK